MTFNMFWSYQDRASPFWVSMEMHSHT